LDLDQVLLILFVSSIGIISVLGIINYSGKVGEQNVKGIITGVGVAIGRHIDGEIIVGNKKGNTEGDSGSKSGGADSGSTSGGTDGGGGSNAGDSSKG
jgi:hypothetical protein